MHTLAHTRGLDGRGQSPTHQRQTLELAHTHFTLACHTHNPTDMKTHIFHVGNTNTHTCELRKKPCFVVFPPLSVSLLFTSPLLVSSNGCSNTLNEDTFKALLSLSSHASTRSLQTHTHSQSKCNKTHPPLVLTIHRFSNQETQNVPASPVIPALTVTPKMASFLKCEVPHTKWLDVCFSQGFKYERVHIYTHPMHSK